MYRFRSVFLSSVVIIALIAVIGYWLFERLKYETTDNAYLKTNIVLLSPKVQGYVTRLFIDDNQSVRQGDVLVVIDDRDYLARVTLAEANMNAVAAHIKSLQLMKISQQDHIGSAKANIVAAQVRAEQINKDLTRFKNLLKHGSATKQSLDSMQSRFKQAIAELSSLQSQLAESKNQLITLDADINEAQARFISTRAQWQLAKLDLSNTRVTAPVDGIIGHRGVQLGQLVRPGMTLAYLVENRKIWVLANFKETQLEELRIGQPVLITVDAYPNLQLQGKVDSFSPASGAEFSILPAENATGNFTKIVRRVPVKIVFDANSDTRLLKSGLSVEVKVKVH